MGGSVTAITDHGLGLQLRPITVPDLENPSIIVTEVSELRPSPFPLSCFSTYVPHSIAESREEWWSSKSYWVRRAHGSREA